ncbi:hypothetical protein DKX38_016415 [Salix brachista]|uniref:Protein kinase domain-containing protein n=1 Tax=Salix brachista TaxID=2182728 RepID=A0A5N5L8E0_9ROSI|nr:hypothetical protein DKX38_016415 [Salix brachista]
MMNIYSCELLILVGSILCLVCVSLKYVPEDNYLIDCGSSTNSSVGDRVFVADQSYSDVLSAPHSISANTSSDSTSSTYDSALYQTAKIFNESFYYTFPIKKPGRHWIRLHFYPFVYRNYNLSMAKFSVSAQNFTLIREYRLESPPIVKEYSVNVTSGSLVLTFTPSVNSFAFINALEVFSLPDELIPAGARTISGLQGNYKNLWRQALETVERVNMGNQTVSPQNDTLWRLWVSDNEYLIHNNLVTLVSNVKAVNFTGAGPTENIAPSLVYGTATRLNSDFDPNINANVTWLFDVDPGFEYLVRFHFCDVLSNPHPRLYFNVYIGSWLVYQNLDLLKLTFSLGAPYFMDVITRASGTGMLNVSVGPSNVGIPYPNAILNGLEIMKISNSEDSLDVLDSISSRSSEVKVIVVVGLTVGLFIIVVLALVLFLLCRRKKLDHADPLKSEGHFPTSGGGNNRHFNGANIFSTSKFGLSWRQRLEICIGAAKGIHYLHTGSTRAIIHRDVKSANILLDENFMAKVADFGLSKTGPELDQSHVSTAVKGSFGYLDPEYLIRQQLTEKSDVYSFGVVIFEVVCGRPVIDPTVSRERVSLVDWALKSIRGGKLEEIVDPRLEGQIKPDSLKKFVEIAEKCLAECGIDRPSMGDVLWNLECSLQLQGNEERSSKNNQISTQFNRGNCFETRVLAKELSLESVDDLDGVSMSKVFAQMVREEMRYDNLRIPFCKDASLCKNYIILRSYSLTDEISFGHRKRKARCKARAAASLLLLAKLRVQAVHVCHGILRAVFRLLVPGRAHFHGLW